MAAKTPITDKASELPAPFAPHVEGNKSAGRYHRCRGRDKQAIAEGGIVEWDIH